MFGFCVLDALYDVDYLIFHYDVQKRHYRYIPCSGVESHSDAEDVDDMDETVVQRLRDIWTKQGVGKDGYLSFDELGAICESMGMDKMSDKVKSFEILGLNIVEAFAVFIKTLNFFH